MYGMLETILTIITISATLGFSAAQLAHTLDGWMGYHAVLEGLKKWAGKRHYKGHYEAVLNKELIGDFSENAQAFYDFHFEIANMNKKFMPWVCIDCMSTRIFFVLFLSVFLLPIEPILYPVIFIVGMAVRKYFI